MMNRYIVGTMVLVLLVLPVFSMSGMSVACAGQKVFRQVTPEDNARANAMLEQANQLREAGNYVQAIALYTNAIHINERLGGYAGRALCHFRMGNFEQAERDANTSIHHRSAKDIMLPGIMGMAEYVRGVCRYQRGEYIAAESDLKTAAASCYGDDEVQRMYRDCEQRVREAKKQARLSEVRAAFNNVDNTVTQALRSGKIVGYDLTRGTSWWRSEEDREDFEKTMGLAREGDNVLQNFTKYLWLKYTEGSDQIDVVAFVPRHIVIDGTLYRDRVMLVTLTPVPRNITQVSELPPATLLYYTHIVEHGGLTQILDDSGCTWESVAQEVVRQSGSTKVENTMMFGHPDDYSIIPTGDAEIYELNHIYEENVTGWLKRVNEPLPPLP